MQSASQVITIEGIYMDFHNFPLIYDPNFHPVLNRNLNKIITTIINFIKCGRSSRVDVQRQTAITSKIVASKEQDLHFEMLGQLWK
uniref:Carboxylesterase n=1 Tax=Meloidogyne javanica TaxID=6303 RepID=A0A915LD64_MELJA